MRLDRIDPRAVASVVALAVVVGLAVPVVGAPGVTVSPGSSSDALGSSTTADPTGADRLVIVPTPEPVPSGFEPVPAGSPAPTATGGSDPQPEPTRTSGGSTTSAAGSAGRPAATAPPKPLFAQPAPVVTATATPGCPAMISGTTPGAPSRTSPLGVAGTTSADLQSFAENYNAIRVANCLPPVPFANIRYDSCMEDRLFWMAEDPSTDPSSAWGHIGSQRSDGLPSVGCDGNLAGGTDNTGSIVAQKWWDSTGHRTSLYKPTYTGSTASVCILFAMTHGGVPNEPTSFTRAAARWVTC
jgi:uncharacterized protein YkwD